MLLFANKLGIHWFFQFSVKTADNRDILSKYNTFKEILKKHKQIINCTRVSLMLDKLLLCCLVLCYFLKLLRK